MSDAKSASSENRRAKKSAASSKSARKPNRGAKKPTPIRRSAAKSGGQQQNSAAEKSPSKKSSPEKIPLKKSATGEKSPPKKSEKSATEKTPDFKSESKASFTGGFAQADSPGIPPFLRETMGEFSQGGGAKFARAWSHLAEEFAQNPELWLTVAREVHEKQWRLLAGMATPGEAEPVAEPSKGDRRFSASEWREQPVFNFLMQHYLLSGEALRRLIESSAISEEDKKLLRFAAEQYLAASSPSNFPATNPEVIAATIAQGGENLTAGMKNLMRDMEAGSVANTDREAFEVGGNLGVTPGKVVFQNPLIQLIEYAPATDKIFARPLLIVPPCINKFYVLDLQPKNSLIAHLVESGFRVFLISWANADKSHAMLDWDDYMQMGIIDAISAASEISGESRLNMTGYCVGGTLLSSALAVMAAHGRRAAESLTLLASLLDFSETGDLSLFTDRAAVEEYEKKFADGGLMAGGDVARTFAVLRPNDLIWPYVVSNYYLGKSPSAFDMLFWNSDSTNLPGRMFARYLRDTYLENKLAKGEAVMCGTKVNLAELNAPSFVVACEKDHIVPWQSAFDSAKLLGGEREFVLAAGGHIAGIVNPPARKKGAFEFGGKESPMESPEKWRASAKKIEGSWWSKWTEWLAVRSGKKIAAPDSPGNYRYRPLQDAPGDYVKTPCPPIN